MDHWIANSVEVHRQLELLLDTLQRSVQNGEFAVEFRAARHALKSHYDEESYHWECLGAHKITHQHEEVLELAAAVEEALAAGQTRDALAIVKRFIALASHNLIEEERDWFPLF